MSRPHSEPISDAAAFRRAVEPIVRALRARGQKPTRDRVARAVGVEPRQVQRLAATLLGMEWSTFARSVPTDEPRTPTTPRSRPPGERARPVGRRR